MYKRFFKKSMTIIFRQAVLMFVAMVSFAHAVYANEGLVPLDDKALAQISGQAGLTINVHAEGTLQAFQFGGPLEVHRPVFYQFNNTGTYFPEDDDVGTNTNINIGTNGFGPYWLPQADDKIDDSDRTNDLFVRAGNWIFELAPDGYPVDPRYAFPAYFVFENITFDMDISNLTIDVDSATGINIGLPDVTVTQLNVGNIALKDDFYNDPSNRYPTITPLENSFGSLSVSGQFNMGGSITVWGH